MTRTVSANYSHHTDQPLTIPFASPLSSVRSDYPPTSNDPNRCAVAIARCPFSPSNPVPFRYAATTPCTRCAGVQTVTVVPYRQYDDPGSSINSGSEHGPLCAAPFARRCPEDLSWSAYGARDPTPPDEARKWGDDTAIGDMEGHRAALDGLGAQAPALRPSKGLAPSLLQRATQAAFQHPVLPAVSHRQGISPCVRLSFPTHRLLFTHTLSRFEEHEEDWYSAYGSVIARGHTDLFKTIQKARQHHSNDGERRRFLINEAPATE